MILTEEAPHLLRALAKADALLHKHRDEDLGKETFYKKAAAALSHDRNVLAQNIHRFCFDLLVHASREEHFRRLAVARQYLTRAPDRVCHHLSDILNKGAHVLLSGVPQTLAQPFLQHKGTILYLTIDGGPGAPGRNFAKKLAQKKCSVRHFSDTSVPAAIAQSDVVFLGEGCLGAHGVYLPAGSVLLATLAQRVHAHIICAAGAWTLGDYSRTMHNAKAFWRGAPQKIHQHHELFELVPFEVLDEIVCDAGRFQPNHALHTIKNQFPWL